MVDIKVIGAGRIAKFQGDFAKLYRFQSRYALFGLNLRTYTQRALDYLQQLTAERTHSKQGHNLKEFSSNLRSSWRVRLASRSTKAIGFELYSSIDGKSYKSVTSGKIHKAEDMLNVIEYGAGATSFTAVNDFTFRNAAYRKVVIRKGQTVNRPPRPAKHLMRDTINYIENTILPQIQKDLEARMQEAFEQVGTLNI